MGIVSSKSDTEVNSTAPSTPGTESVEPAPESSCTSAPGLGFNLMSSSSSFSVSYGLSQIQVLYPKMSQYETKISTTFVKVC